MNTSNSKRCEYLTTKLKKFNSRDSYLKKGKQLISLNKGNYKEWLRELLPNTRLIIEPKIVGESIALIYEDGKLKKAITKKGKTNLKKIPAVKNIPEKIAFKEFIQILGQVYLPDVLPEESKRQAKALIKNNNEYEKNLIFCAFQILNSKQNQLSQISSLNILGFQVPHNKRTSFSTSEIDLYRKMWIEGKLFNQYPTDGIVVKTNSKKLQNQLGENNGYSNWAYVITK